MDMKSSLARYLNSIKKRPICHKSNEMVRPVAIESQSRQAPPSPTRLQSSTNSPPSMFLDLPLIYSQEPQISHVVCKDYRALILHGYKLIKNPGGYNLGHHAMS